MKLRKSVKAAMNILCIENLRQNQQKPINAILDGKDTMVIAPTSFGKSLIYQIPAVISDGLTVVIEPLLALMHDQAQKLNGLGVPAACLNSTLSTKDRKSVWRKIKENRLKLLYLTPEQLAHGILQELSIHVRIDIVVVDECHCVTMWGSTFRNGYLGIGEQLNKLPYHPTVVAMSASVVPAERKAIMESLSMTDVKLCVFPLYRSNLVFSQKSVKSRKAATAELLRVMTHYHQNTTIIFCNTVKAAESVAKKLESKKKYADDVILYHGRDKSHEREMLSGKKHIIVATSALSLGVDLRGVDLVVHYNMPLSLAEYSQMAGRAGRDGQKARSVLIYNPDDYNTNYGLLQSIENASARKRAIKLLDEMKEYCEDDKHCMVMRLLKALGEDHKKNCRYCTVCQKGRRNS